MGVRTWIRTCHFTIFWYLQRATKTQTACASVHFQYSIDGSGMSSITAFMLNGSLILCLTTQTTTWKKALLYISLYKQTNLVNLLSCLTLWFTWLFKVTSSTVTCECSILTTRQRMSNDLYIYRSLVKT